MKSLAMLAMLAVLLVPATLAAETLPDIKDSAVTIPWGEFKQILEKLQQGTQAVEPDPPVDYTLGRGALSGSLNDGRLELTTQYPLSVLKKGWVLCPLVDTSAPLAEVLIDGKTAPVTDYNGQVALVLKGPATHMLTMRFRVTATMRPGPGTASLALPRAAGQVLSLSVGPKLSGVTVDGATMSQDSAGRVMAILTGDSLTVRYAVASEKKEGDQEKLPPKVLVENSTLISIDEGFIRAVVQLAYEVRHAPVNTFTLVIPSGFDVADCSGASLVGWKLDDKSRVLTATVGFDVKGAYSLTIVLERSTKEESFAFPLPGIQARDVERERGFFAVQVTGGVEVTPGDMVKGLHFVDAKELPSGLRSGATNPIVLSFKYLRHPFSADLNVVRHKTQPVLGAAIDAVNYVVQVTDDGDCVTRALYTVRNNRKQFLEVTLPPVEKIALWSSFVADKPVKPSKTKEGKILIQLEKSSYQGSELNAFSVEIIYYSSLGASLHPLGGLDLRMPEVDLPISRSMLTVYAPGRFAYTRVGGSLRQQYVAHVSKPISLGFLGGAKMADESSMAAPPPSPKKAKMGLMSRSESKLEAQQQEAEQVFQTRIRAAQKAQDATGALPARFSVPQQGVSMRFEELITIGEASNVRLLYAARKVMSGLNFVLLVITAALGWFARWLLTGPPPRKNRHLLFGAGVAAIVLLVIAGASVGSVVGGALIGLGGRLFVWIVIQIAKQRQQVPGQG